MVRVTPRASCTRIEAKDDEIRIWVTATPTDGQANDAVCRVIVDALRVARARVQVVRGQTSRMKTLAVSGLNAETVRERLAGSGPPVD